MGKNNISAVETENIVALCDVDDAYAAETFKKYPRAKTYRDFRRMLERQRNIDAVIVATPDHTHAVLSKFAMKMGKHEYSQKPMTRTVYEARMLTEAARKYKVVTQMGNQGHSDEGVRLICEWIWDGAIGPVREVHAWTDRPFWPQGIDRPKDTPPVPSTLDWDLWLGPVPERPYNPAYLPFKWRGWWDFGCGALGDMACHVMDPIFAALKLGYPTQVQASSSKVNSETAPVASIVHYSFPARRGMPPVKVTWYDGGLMPALPDELELERKLNDSGVIFVGDKGKLTCHTYSNSPRLIPETKMQEYKRPPKTLPRIPNGRDGHEQDWVRACKGGKPACSNFDYAGPMTESVVLGNLAIRMGRNVRLNWDGQNMKVTNNEPDANKYVNEPYRKGWSL
jgi:predicted dehydrogenase